MTSITTFRTVITVGPVATAATRCDHRSSCGRFEVNDDRIHHDGRRLPLSPSAHRLVAAVMKAAGRTLSYMDAVLSMGSSSRNPPSVVKVMLHALRRASQGLIPIVTVRGVGLRWAGTEAADIEPSGQTPTTSTGRGSKHAELSRNAEGHPTLDGVRLTIPPLTARLINHMMDNRTGLVETTELAKALRIRSETPACVIKVALHHARREFERHDAMLPIRCVRGRGLAWTG